MIVTHSTRLLPVFLLLQFWIAWTAQAESVRFGVHVIDDQTQRGVPLVEFRSVNDVCFWTDSGGYIAIDEPGWHGQEIHFHVSSPGYEVPADGFGYRGVRLKIMPGGDATVRIRRMNLAERLYRVTGAGIYRDTILLGKPAPIQQPLLNARVFGSDSVLTAIFRDKIYWFWGDTNRPNYPLGNFHSPGATSLLPGQGGLDPDVGVNLKYFVAPDGFAKPTCEMPGNGPTWIEGLTVIGVEQQQRMFACYAKIKPPLTVYELGIVEFDHQTEQFHKLISFGPDEPAYPMGHPVQHSENGIDYIYFCKPLPWVRVKATADALLDPSQYETYTYLKTGSRENDMLIDRDATGRLQWAWRRDTPRPTRELEQRLVRAGKLQEAEQALRLQVAGSDRRFTLHTASIAWNEYRRRWIMIGLEAGGESSYLGEVYYTEADELLGLWKPAVKVVTHDKYSFYNPRLHPMLTSKDGRVIYFEGTYTTTFSAAKTATPRYDYNQIMYRLDLGGPIAAAFQGIGDE